MNFFKNLNMVIRLLMISSGRPSPLVRVDKVAHPGYFHNATMGSLDSQASQVDVPVPHEHWIGLRDESKESEGYRLPRWYDNNNNNNFIDFIFDMKISVPKQSIQWQMKQSKMKVK